MDINYEKLILNFGVFMKVIFVLLFSFTAYGVDCGNEIEKLCAGAKSDFAKCVKENVSKLPAQCRSEVSSFSNMANDLGSNCMGDLMKFCPIDMNEMQNNLETASLKQAECLKKNKSKFSAKCNELLNKLSKALGGDIDGGSNAKKIR